MENALALRKSRTARGYNSHLERLGLNPVGNMIGRQAPAALGNGRVSAGSKPIATGGMNSIVIPRALRAKRSIKLLNSRKRARNEEENPSCAAGVPQTAVPTVQPPQVPVCSHLCPLYPLFGHLCLFRHGQYCLCWPRQLPYGPSDLSAVQPTGPTGPRGVKKLDGITPAGS